MTFVAVTKNIKSMYSSSDFERLFIRYKAETMPRKSILQGYKTSNRTCTSSSRMANSLGAYHTLLSTYRMNGLSALEYLKKFFHKIVKGRKDYENLLPVTIGISTNKY